MKLCLTRFFLFPLSLEVRNSTIRDRKWKWIITNFILRIICTFSYLLKSLLFNFNSRLGTVLCPGWFLQKSCHPKSGLRCTLWALQLCGSWILSWRLCTSRCWVKLARMAYYGPMQVSRVLYICQNGKLLAPVFFFVE